ncbi:MAG: prolipoprotein diacylglyceryl transferase [Pirellulaceae bacterium]
MRSTLFYIPHEIGGYPLFGWGLLLTGLLVSFFGWALWQLSTKRPMQEVLSGIPFLLITAAVVTFVLPNVETVWPAADGGPGVPIGLPIRGYGVMVLLGLLCGIGISILRGRQLGIQADLVIGLGFWMMLGGVMGARVFYVVQKWDEFGGDLLSIFKVTEGGLVIYGGVIGGLVAGGIFCYRNKLNVAATADLVAPGFLIGLSLGRIGCLLHGCCFGGVCHSQLPTITFPHGSGPYQAQIESGELLGLDLTHAKELPVTVDSVVADSLADQADIRAGDQIVAKTIQSILPDRKDDPTQPPKMIAEIEWTRSDGETSDAHSRRIFLPENLPARSLPVHPSQLYASFNALLLCLLVWFLQPLPKRDGMTFLLAILLYAISRFLLEGVRSDEAGQFGTPFSIAQIVAIISAAAATIGLVALRKLPAKRAWKWAKAPNAT